MTFEFLDFLIVFIVALFGGAYSTLVGGGSLITIPTLIFLGLSPSLAIATNRTGVIGVPIAGWYKFHKKKKINYKIGWIIAIPAFIGAFFGAQVVLNLDEEFLRKMIAAFTLTILVLLILKPNMGIESLQKKIKHKHYILGGILSLFIGFYGGVYGAGAGTFFSYLLIILFGQTMIESAATRKIAGFSFNAMAAVVFLYHGVVIFSIAIVLFLGTFIGSYIGATYSDTLGNVWIKRLFTALVIIMSINLFFF